MKATQKATQLAILAVVVVIATAMLSAQVPVLTIYTFPTGDNNPASPVSPTWNRADGNIYGTTTQGGSGPCGGGCGTVYKLAWANGRWNQTTLHSFTGPDQDGSLPNGGLVFDAQGNFYGSTRNGGLYGDGIVFELSPPTGGHGWTETVLHNFGAGNDGILPNGYLWIDRSGNLYGTANGGGGNNCDGGCGTFFELVNNQGQYTFKVLYNWNEAQGTTGAYPNELLWDPNSGGFFGTTFTSYQNGAPTGGTVFQLVPTQSGEQWQLNVLYTFQRPEDGYDGARPSPAILYSKFLGPGSHDWQAILQQIVHQGALEMEGQVDGFDPLAGLAIDASGNLYGTTSKGGFLNDGWCSDGCGTVFELSPPSSPGGTWTEQVLHDFTGPPDDGLWSQSPVTLWNGGVYGTTNFGGSHVQQCGGLACGVVYGMRQSQAGWTWQILRDFDYYNGLFPYGRQTIGPDGGLYGTAFLSSPYGYGVVYKIP